MPAAAGKRRLFSDHRRRTRIRAYGYDTDARGERTYFLYSAYGKKTRRDMRRPYRPRFGNMPRKYFAKDETYPYVHRYCMCRKLNK